MPKMQLADGTEVLAEAGSVENDIDGERGGKIPEYDPRCGARRVPQRERFIGPQVQGQQACRDPLGAQAVWPAKTRGHELPGEISWKRKWAGHAEQISSHQQRDNGQA